MKREEKNNIRANVTRNGIVLYSCEIPEVGVFTYKEKGEVKAKLIQCSEEKYYKEKPSFAIQSIFILASILSIGICTYISTSQKLLFVLLTLMASNFILYHYYEEDDDDMLHYDYRNIRQTTLKTATWMTINAYKNSKNIPNLRQVLNAKPYEVNSVFIEQCKLNFLLYLFMVPFFIIEDVMTACVCSVMLSSISSILERNTNFLNRIFDPLQLLISKKPREISSYCLAIQALENYERIFKKIGFTRKEAINLLYEKVKNEADT